MRWTTASTWTTRLYGPMDTTTSSSAARCTISSSRISSGRNETIGFNANETSAAPAQGGGLGFASLMLGEADNGGTNVTVHAPRWISWYYGFFAQDDFKVTPNLTLNIGLRYDVEVPRKEALNLTSNFSPTAIDPEYNIPGALVFGDKCHCNTRWADTWHKDFAPRLGFAWTPGFLKGQTVVRGGAGIIYGPLLYSDFGGGMATGYTVNPNAPATTASIQRSRSITGCRRLRRRPNEDPGIYNGSFVPSSYITRDAARPATVYIWNMEIQHQVATDLIATVGYIGNHSTDLNSNLLNPNNMSTKYFGLGDALYQPFEGNSAGIQRRFPQFLQNWGGNPQLQQALRPFPQYDFIDQGCCLENVGMSSFNALVSSLQRHYHQGLNLQVSYTLAHTFTDADSALPNVGQRVVQDMHVENLHLEKAVSWLDLRHTFVFSGLYELPFGKGKQYLNHGFMSQIAGGWEVGTVERMQSGQPSVVWLCRGHSGVPELHPLQPRSRILAQKRRLPQWAKAPPTLCCGGPRRLARSRSQHHVQPGVQRCGAAGLPGCGSAHCVLRCEQQLQPRLHHGHVVVLQRIAESAVSIPHRPSPHNQRDTPASILQQRHQHHQEVPVL